MRPNRLKSGELIFARSIGPTVSVLLIPGVTDTATMFDFWPLILAGGTAAELGSGGGAEGRASNIRCKCRVKIDVRNER